MLLRSATHRFFKVTGGENKRVDDLRRDHTASGVFNDLRRDFDGQEFEREGANAPR